MVLTKMKGSVSFESFMDLRNYKISTGNKLFPTDVLNQAIEKASEVLHDEAIRKAVTRDKPLSRGKKLQFSTMPRKQQGPQSKKPTGSSFRQSAARSSSSPPPLGEGEEVLKVSHLPCSHRCSEQALECLAIVWCRRLDGWIPPGWLPCPVPPPPTCVAGSQGAIVILSGNRPCARPPGGGQQDAPD